MDHEELEKLVEKIKIMPLRPNDRIVLRLKQTISMETASRLREWMQNYFSGHRVLVLDSDADIDLIRDDQAAEEFIPTHRHVEGGGFYRFLHKCSYKTTQYDWSDCIIYQDKDRKMYVTTPARWADRFTQL